jgi:hypothetical protein
MAAAPTNLEFDGCSIAKKSKYMETKEKTIITVQTTV